MAPLKSSPPAAELSEQLKLYDTATPMREIAVRTPSPPPSAPALRRTRVAGRAPARPADPLPGVQLADRIEIAARRYDIDPGFLRALIRAESGGRPGAVSPKGALGLMQVTPATGRLYGAAPSDLIDPQRNLAAGAEHLKALQRRYGNNLPLILAAYNAGEGAVARHGQRVPPYRETLGYVVRVLADYQTTRLQEAR